MIRLDIVRRADRVRLLAYPCPASPVNVVQGLSAPHMDYACAGPAVSFLSEGIPIYSAARRELATPTGIALCALDV